jgi:hypothetical protein
VLATLDVSGPPSGIEVRLREALAGDGAPGDAATSTALDGILRALTEAIGGELPAPSQGRVFRDRYLGLAHEFLEFASAFADLSHRASDMRDSLASLYGHLAGWCLADYARHSARTGRADPGAAAVTRVLAGGV